MQRFHAPVFMAVIRDLSLVTAQMAFDKSEGYGATRIADIRSTIEPDIEGVESQVAPLPIGYPVKRKVARLMERVQTDETLTVDVLEVLLKELSNDVIQELQQLYFLLIPNSRRELYAQKRPVFGNQVAAQFPDLSKDIAAAGRCVALDEWTAAVFHLMRVLEASIHELAAWVGVTFSKGDQEQWKNALDQIEKRIRDMEQRPASPEKSRDLTFYSGLVAQFRWFKDAWRNHVSHARTHYDEREALEVWNHVEPFIQQLAEHKERIS